MAFHTDRSIEIASDIAFIFASYHGVKEWDPEKQVIDYISNRFKIYTNSILLVDEKFRGTSWLIKVKINDVEKIVPVNSDVVFEDIEFLETDLLATKESAEDGQGFILEMIPYKYDTLLNQLKDYQDQSTSRSIDQGLEYRYFIGVNKRTNDETREN